MHKILCALIIASGFTALFPLAIAGPSHRLARLDLGQAFSLMRWAFYLGVASVLLVLGYSLWRRPGRRVATALAGLCAAYIPLSLMQSARSVPAIHDLSTDLNNPPEFVDVVPLRPDAPNPHEYAGEETAEQQRKAYPDLQPLMLEAELEQVYHAAMQVVAALNWELVGSAQDGETARIEATDTTFWFGFNDDIVIRLGDIETGTRLDIRSKSRVGRSDVGKNAERIREFTRALDRTLRRS